MSFKRAPVMGRFDQNGNLVGFEDFAGQIAEGAGGFEGNFAAAVVGAASNGVKRASTPVSISAYRDELSYGGTVISAGTTVTQQRQFVAPVRALQLIYANPNPGAGMVVSAAGVIAVSADLDTGAGTPTIASTLPTLAAASGSASNIVPTIGVTEQLAVRSVNDLNLFQLRSYFAAAATGLSAPAGVIEAFSGATGQLMGSRSDAAANLVSPWNALASAPARTGAVWWVPHGVRAWYDVPCRTIAIPGDSRARGQASTGGNFSGAARACNALSSSSFVVDYMNFAISGQSTAASVATARKILALADKPDAMIIGAWSPNDTQDQATADASWFLFITLLDELVRAGITPILKTSYAALLDAGQDAIRRAQDVRIRNLGNRFVIADLDPILSDLATPSRIKAAYNSGDGLHMNDAGYAAEQIVFQAAIREVFSV